MKTTLSLVVVFLVAFSYAQTARPGDEDSDDEAAFGGVGTTEKPQKYAPAYCWSFRLNCEKRKEHTCCRYPLPPKDGLSPSALNSIRPAGVRIRPFRLPGKTPVENGEDTENEGQEQAEGEDRPQAQVAQEKRESSDEDSDDSPSTNRPQSGSLFRRKPSFSMKKPSVEPEQKASAESEPKRPSFSPIHKPGGFMSKLCTRLVTDCTTQPTHHCCKQKLEQAADSAPEEAEQTQEEPTEEGAHEGEEIQQTGEAGHEDQNAPIQEEAQYEQDSQANLEQEQEEEQEGDEQNPSIRDVQDDYVGDFEDEEVGPNDPTEQPSLDENYPVLENQDQSDVVPSVTVVDIVTGNLGGQVAPSEGDYQPGSPLPGQQGGEQVEYYEYDDEEFPAYPAGEQKQAILSQPEAGVYQKIPAECFTRAYDCNTDPAQLCCSYQ